jgi:hypothetical protein
MPVRLLLAAVLAGVATFLVGFVTHMLLEDETRWFGRVPDEPTLLAAIDHALPPGPGMYAFPQAPDTKGMDGHARDAAYNAYMEQAKGKPLVMLIRGPVHAQFIDPTQLVNQLLGDIASALCVGLILVLGGPAGYGARVLVGVLAVLAGGCLARVPQWNWYGFGTGWTVMSMVDDALRALGGALVLGAILKPKR